MQLAHDSAEHTGLAWIMLNWQCCKGFKHHLVNRRRIVQMVGWLVSQSLDYTRMYVEQVHRHSDTD